MWTSKIKQNDILLSWQRLYYISIDNIDISLYYNIDIDILIYMYAILN